VGLAQPTTREEVKTKEAEMRQSFMGARRCTCCGDRTFLRTASRRVGGLVLTPHQDEIV
jgi:hypothetical protein